MKKYIICILLVTTSFLAAQNTMFEKDESGFDISYHRSMELGNWSKSVLTTGYNINGRFNFGLDLGYRLQFKTLLLYDLGAHAHYITFKQNKRVPINLAFGLRFNYLCDSDFGESYNENIIGLDIGVSHSFKTGKKYRITPVAEIEVIYNSLRIEEGFTYHSFQSSLKGIISNEKFYIYPQISYALTFENRGYYLFSWGFGLLFKTNTSKEM